jgi:hypothetical protein
VVDPVVDPALDPVLVESVLVESVLVVLVSVLESAQHRHLPDPPLVLQSPSIQ